VWPIRLIPTLTKLKSSTVGRSHDTNFGRKVHYHNPFVYGTSIPICCDLRMRLPKTKLEMGWRSLLMNDSYLLLPLFFDFSTYSQHD
jgi:hypothetical protein